MSRRSRLSLSPVLLYPILTDHVFERFDDFFFWNFRKSCPSQIFSNLVFNINTSGTEMMYHEFFEMITFYFQIQIYFEDFYIA
jgi:hypothetical protein